MSLMETPRANRLHIGLFGRRNSGKSSLINALTGQQTAIVSAVAGTTADPVYKAMELHGIGPVVFIDTAGFDDTGSLGALRVEKTRAALEKTDIALLLFRADREAGLQEVSKTELHWFQDLKEKKTPVIPILSQTDRVGADAAQQVRKRLEAALSQPVLAVSAESGVGVESIREALIAALPEDDEARDITRDLVQEGETVLLVMPQDIQAPRGRLILPQVQILRELLDRKCVTVCTTADLLDQALAALTRAPELIITDSQVFRAVYEKKPKESRLTSFSVLFAGYKGDSRYFQESTAAVDDLRPDSHVLIAEACTHAPLSEDIGREQIPRMLRDRVGDMLDVTIVSGQDFPQDLTPYDLIIHCGACMFNRKYVLSRVKRARGQGVPMTNYGMLIAKLNGILDQIER